MSAASSLPGLTWKDLSAVRPDIAATGQRLLYTRHAP